MTKGKRWRRVASVASVVAIAGGAPLPVVAGAAGNRIDLRSDAPVQISGAGEVAAAGDVNGDGLPDVLVSRGDIVKQPSRGRSWVVFGSTDLPAVVGLDDLGSRGFVIEGAEEGDYASRIASAGDVNGDGLDDVIVGASGADNNGRSSSGTAYIVFGKTDVAPVQLEDFDSGMQGSQGFRIDGPAQRALAGEDVAGVGDVNGDGRDDVAVGAPFVGATYVVYGKDDPLSVDLLTHDLGGSLDTAFRIDTPSPDHSDGYAVAGAGDVNGDGVPDVVIGAQRRTGSDGDAFVVFGSTTPQDVDATQRGQWGFRVKGHFGGSATGYAVAPTGDVDGDGLDDVMVAAPALYFPLEGQTFVVYGKRGFRSVRLADLGSQGFVVNGAAGGNASGTAVAGGRDVNGDGVPDLLIGAPWADTRKRRDAGKAYVVHGGTVRRSLNLRRLRTRGTTIVGAMGPPQECRPDFGQCPGDYAGRSVAQLGDIDGDGRSEIAIGAPWAGRPGQSGRVYIVWSSAL